MTVSTRLDPPRPVGASGTPVSNVLPFRPRDPAVRRRFRRHPVVRWGRPLLAALLIVGTPCATVWWMMTSARFALREIEIQAGARVPERWVRQTLASVEGRNLLQLPLERVAASVEVHPWAAAVEVSKELPGTLRVVVREREPVAVHRAGPGLVYLDGEGHEIEAVGSARPAGPDLPVISGREGRPPRPDELAGAVALAQGLEDDGWASLVAPRVSEVEVLGEGEFRVWLEELGFPVVLRGDLPEPSPERLVELLPEVRRRFDVAEIDLRFEDRIIVQTGGDGVVRAREEKG